MWRIEFTSAEFLPYLPEDAQSNPGVYGFELAHWLSRALMERGIATTYPLGEDWGWLLEYFDGGLEVRIGCASMAQDGEGYTGRAIDWSIFVEAVHAPGGLFTRSRKVTAPARITDTIAAALAAKGIRPDRVE